MAHDQEIVGLNPGTVYWMDVSDASYYITEKLKIKVAKWGTPKKYLKKLYCVWGAQIFFGGRTLNISDGEV
jgi:hypothetical protein